ncbi:MAG TPA: SMC-Scp complex subunit ScpB [Patescibacteria group bacterium]|jgi:segregation and condensation protein B|nr:SMC-Scp complex subunit ScpB [Patescibacteria group bacterium]
MQELFSQIESLLFVSNKPLTLKQLVKFTDSNEADIKQALQQLASDRLERGVVLLDAPDGYQLATNSANSEIVKNFLNADLREGLTEATVEVLAIIGYRQPISKAEIEAIRGVNSQYSLRALLMRGLIEKIPNPNDARGSLYQVTTEFLQHMGITSVEELPDFAELVAKIQLPETPQINSEVAAEGLDTNSEVAVIEISEEDLE